MSLTEAFPGICLRPAVPSDAENVAKWMNDPETTKYLGYGFLKPRRLEDVREELRMQYEGELTGCSFAIVNGEKTGYFGQAGLILPDERAKTAEITLVLTPEARGKGIAKRALKLLLRFGFCECGYQKLCARCLSANAKALKLFESAGFTREGVLRRHMRTAEGLTDVVLYGMLREEYEKQVG